MGRFNEEILELICEHARRWETVLLRGPEELSNQLSASIQDPLDHLRELTIEIP
ncbi:hypothetical protein K438DRAFT_407930 [Mycena galopus ATCC 62051]|nr:hypothetical protein K438DRAFT_407930 [Mycena galopus ATCC 62051]